MKGIVLAGGKGTRLRPLTDVMSKELIPVGEYPMVCYAIDKLRRAGIADILLVVCRQSAAMYMDFFGSGSSFGVSLSYAIQEEQGGVAHALAAAEGFAGTVSGVVVILGDNLFEDDLRADVEAFAAKGKGAAVFLKKVSDPRPYGVPIFHYGKVVRIEEKPERPLSDYCVTGIYMYDSSVFEKIRRIRPSSRGELEITDINNLYAGEGDLEYKELSGWWVDAGTFPSLQYVQSKLRRPGEEPKK